MIVDVHFRVMHSGGVLGNRVVWLQGKSEDAPFSAGDLIPSVVKNYAKYAALEFQPVCTVFGGIVAQEIVKFTGACLLVLKCEVFLFFPCMLVSGS